MGWGGGGLNVERTMGPTEIISITARPRLNWDEQKREKPEGGNNNGRDNGGNKNGAVTESVGEPVEEPKENPMGEAQGRTNGASKNGF